MKERPIIFSGPSIPAILDGRKTQTRRLMKPQPPTYQSGLVYLDAYNGGPQWNFWDKLNRVMNNMPMWTCPYGVPGERLWVKEAWRLNHNPDSPKNGQVEYRADYQDAVCQDLITWRSPRFMPKDLARIWIEITEIRVQRVQEISIDDLYAEGCPALSSDEDGSELYEWYSDLWDSINGKGRIDHPPGVDVLHEAPHIGGGAWVSNPWVWAISFRRLRDKA
jgi:hypothetical protein